MDHPEWRYTQKCVTPKGNFPFGVRFSPFLASQHRPGVSTLENSKSDLKTQQGIYIAGNIIFDSKTNRQTPHPKMWYSERENLPFGVPHFGVKGV